MHVALRPCRCLAILILITTFSTSLRAAEESAPDSVTLKFHPRLGRIHIPAAVNDGESQFFLLDTGYGIDMIKPQLADTLELRRAGRIDIIGIAGREEAVLYRGARYRFGGMAYRPRRVAALPSHSRQRRAGILGVDFFKRFVIEIHAADGSVTLHEPERFEYRGTGQVFPLTFHGDSPVIETVVASNGKSSKARFEIDTGCDSALCVDGDFARKHSWLNIEEAGRKGERNGVGGSARTESGRIGEVRLGDLKVKEPRVNFFESGSLSEEGLAGHIGFELLKPYRMIFDYRRDRLILER